MINQSFLQIINSIIKSVVSVGVYYGFLTTFSTAPSYLLFLRAHFMQGEEGIQRKCAATTGFIMGQLLMFISIYYTPLYLALGRPHTITVLALPYVLCQFFWNNNKDFWGLTNDHRNYVKNGCEFLNNLIFQLFNHFILPSSMVAKLINISMFRCNNKIVFCISGFVGWFIGHILFLKGSGLVEVWIRENYFIFRNKKYAQSKTFLVSELRNYSVRIVCILLLIPCIYDLGRMPSPILTARLSKQTPKVKVKQKREGQQEADVEIDTASEMKRSKDEKDPSSEESSATSFVSKETDFVFNEQLLLNFFFDPKRWNQPVRYIKNTNFVGTVRNEMSQYFFDICQSDGKERISFTYPASLSIFFEMLKRAISPRTFEQSLPHKLWLSTNKENYKSLNNELKNRIEALGEKFRPLNILDTRTQLCNDHSKNEYLSKKYDPFVTKSYRQRGNKTFLPSILKPIGLTLNRISGLFLSDTDSIDFPEFNEPNFDMTRFDEKFDEKTLSIRTEILSLFDKHNKDREWRVISYKFLRGIRTEINDLVFSRDATLVLRTLLTQIVTDQIVTDQIVTDSNDQQMIRLNAISKKVLRWSYKLLTDLDTETQENPDNAPEANEIASRRFTSVVIYTPPEKNSDDDTNRSKKRRTPPPTSNSDDDTNLSKKRPTSNSDDDDATSLLPPKNSDDEEEKQASLIRFRRVPDFKRNLPKGSMRAQRRKVGIFQPWDPHVHSPLYWDRARDPLLVILDIVGIPQVISGLIILISRKRVGRREAVKKIVKYRQEKKTKTEAKAQARLRKKLDLASRKRKKEKERMRIAETWDNVAYAHILRTAMLLTQSYFRKSILLPSLIIGKNLVRLLLLQVPELFEDFDELGKEVHIRCSYGGVPISHKDLPSDWKKSGLQIKILFPFCLRPWNKLKLGSSQNDPLKQESPPFSFLTIWGMQAQRPFGAPRKRPPFFKPIFRELKNKIRQFKKFKKKYFGVQLVVKENENLVKDSKEAKNWGKKSGVLVKKIKEFSKVNPSRLFRLREVDIDESSKLKEEKDALLSNQISHESLSQVVSPSWTNSSFTEKKINDLADRTSTIRNQIEKISKEKVTPRINNLISATKTNSNATRFEKWQLLKRRNARIICKLPLFLKFFIERRYTDIFLPSINILKINTKLFLKFTQKIIEKSISNNSRNQEIILKKKKNPFSFFSFFSKLLDNISDSFDYYSFDDLSDISQAYVFYKLSTIQVSNKFRSFLSRYYDYEGIPFFAKPEIKDSFEKQGVLRPKLQRGAFPRYELNGWKRWLKGHYQSNFSKKKRSRLIQKKWRNALPKHKKKIVRKGHSYNYYEKYYEEEEVDSLSNQKDTFPKDYRYDLLSFKFIDYEKKYDLLSSKFIDYEKKYESFFFKFYKNVFRGIFYTYNKRNNYRNLNTNKKAFWLRPLSIDGRSYQNTNLGRGDTLYMNRVADERCVASGIITHTQKDLYYLMIPEKAPPNSPKGFFNWLGMNEKILTKSIGKSNRKSGFFPEFVLLSNSYKMNPWFIPSESLLFNFYRNQFDEKKKIVVLDKNDCLASTTKAKKKPGDPGFGLSQPKDGEGMGGRFATKLLRKARAKGYFPSLFTVRNFLKRYLLFHVRWNKTLHDKLMENLRVFCLLLQLEDPTKMFESSVQSERLSLDLASIRTSVSMSEVTKGEVLVVDLHRVSILKSGQFSMYQTIDLSLIHKSKQQMNQKYHEQIYVSKNQFGEASSTHQRIPHKIIPPNLVQKRFDFIVPENILSFKRRKKLRILSCFNSKTRKNIARNPVFWNEKNLKNRTLVSHDTKHLDKEKNQLMKVKFFLWPNYRLEDLACMNRYWFDTNNGTRFSMLRIQMYPRLKFSVEYSLS